MHGAQRAVVPGELFSPASWQARHPYTPPTRLKKEPLSPHQGPSCHCLVDGGHWFLAYGDTLPSVIRCKWMTPVAARGRRVRAGPAARSLPWAPGWAWQPPSPSVRRPRPSRPWTSLGRQFTNFVSILLYLWNDGWQEKNMFGLSVCWSEMMSEATRGSFAPECCECVLRAACRQDAALPAWLSCSSSSALVVVQLMGSFRRLDECLFREDEWTQPSVS